MDEDPRMADAALMHYAEGVPQHPLCGVAYQGGGPAADRGDECTARFTDVTCPDCLTLLRAQFDATVSKAGREMAEPRGPEPTLADLLAELRAMRADLGDTRADLTHRSDRIEAAIGQVRADVAAVKVDTAYVESHIDDHQTAIQRHVDDPHAHRRAA